MSGQKSVYVEMPKEIQVKNLRLELDAENGKAILSAESLEAENKDTIKAQSQREKAFLSKSGELVEKASEGATEGAVKGALKGVVP